MKTLPAQGKTDTATIKSFLIGFFSLWSTPRGTFIFLTTEHYVRHRLSVGSVLRRFFYFAARQCINSAC